MTSNMPSDLPPHDLAAEASVLGSMILDPAVTLDAIARLSPDDFWRGSNRTIFAAIVALSQDGQPVDGVTVADQLDRDGHLTDVGGALAVADLSAAVPTTTNYRYYRNVVMEMAERRRLIEEARSLTVAARDRGQLPVDIANRHGENLIYELAAGQDDWPSWDDDELDELPDPTWLVDGMIPEGLSVLYGPSNAGKSFFAVDLALSLVNRVKFMRREVSARPVVYWAGEAAFGYKQRRKAWLQHNLSSDRGSGQAGFTLTNGTLNLRDAGDVGRLSRLIEQKHAGLVVIDTMARGMAGDENSAEDVAEVVRSCDRIIKRTGCSVLLVHHEGKDAVKGMRGSTALYGASDAVMRLWRPEEDAREEWLSRQVQITCTKMKDAPFFDSVHADLLSAGSSALLSWRDPKLTGARPPAWVGESI